MVGQTLLGWEIPGVQFEVAVHVATLISVLVIYRSRLIDLLGGMMRRDRNAWQYVGLLALATLPAALVGVFFAEAIEAHFESPFVPATASSGDGSGPVEHTLGAWARGLEETRVGRALLIGFAQAFAWCPASLARE